MRQGLSFGRILDEKLGQSGFAWASPLAAQSQRPWQPGPRPVFLFGDMSTGFSAGPARPAAIAGADARSVVGAPRPEVPPRSVRRLSPAQQQALECLQALGARTLAADYTEADLKSAFRTLAMTFHPDRHPGIADAERARLGKAFASACEAYRTLSQGDGSRQAAH